MTEFLDPTNYRGFGKQNSIDIDWIATNIILPAVSRSYIIDDKKAFIRAVENFNDLLSARIKLNKNIRQEINTLEKDLNKTLEKIESEKDIVEAKSGWAQELLRILVRLVDGQELETKSFEA